jgi:hypothetical protein
MKIKDSFVCFHEKQKELKIYQMQLQDYRNEINKVFTKILMMIFILFKFFFFLSFNSYLVNSSSMKNNLENL